MTPQLSLVLLEDAMSQINVDSLEECLGDMESVDLVRLSHNGHLRLRVPFGHCASACRCRRKLFSARFKLRAPRMRMLQKDTVKLCQPPEQMAKLSRAIICLNYRVKGYAGRLQAKSPQIEATVTLSEQLPVQGDFSDFDSW